MSHLVSFKNFTLFYLIISEMNFNQLVTLAHLENVKLAHATYIAHVLIQHTTTTAQCVMC